jgi:hypothetical protein
VKEKMTDRINKGIGLGKKGTDGAIIPEIVEPERGETSIRTTKPVITFSIPTNGNGGNSGNNGNSENGKWYKNFWFIGFALIAIIGTIIVSYLWGLIGFGIIVMSVIIVILFILSLYYVFAPQNNIFTFLEEGTTKMVMRGGSDDKLGEFDYALIGWKGYIFKGTIENVSGTEYWDVVKGEEPKNLFRKTFGGLRYFGIPPFQRIFSYRHKWTHLHENGEAVSHNEILDYVFLKKDIYVIEIPLIEKRKKEETKEEAEKQKTEEEGAEDIDGIPLGISIIVPMEIINPYEALFSVRRWMPMITGIILTKLRRFTASYRYKEDLINMKAGAGITERQKQAGIPEDERDELGTDLWKKFWGQIERELQIEGGQTIDAEKKLIRICGVKIFGNETGILKIDPSTEYRKFTTLKYEAERNKEVTIINAEAQQEARSTKTAGAIIRAIMKTTGETEEQVQKKISKNPELSQKILEFNADLITREIELEKNGLVDIRVGGTGTTGLESFAAPLIAMYQKLTQGKGGE